MKWKNGGMSEIFRVGTREGLRKSIYNPVCKTNVKRQNHPSANCSKRERGGWQNISLFQKLGQKKMGWMGRWRVHSIGVSTGQNSRKDRSKDSS